MSLSLSSWSLPSVSLLSEDKGLIVQKRNHRTHMLWRRESEWSQQRIQLFGGEEQGRGADWSLRELDKDCRTGQLWARLDQTGQDTQTWRMATQKQKTRWKACQKVKQVSKKKKKRKSSHLRFTFAFLRGKVQLLFNIKAWKSSIMWQHAEFPMFIRVFFPRLAAVTLNAAGLVQQRIDGLNDTGCRLQMLFFLSFFLYLDTAPLICCCCFFLIQQAPEISINTCKKYRFTFREGGCSTCSRNRSLTDTELWGPILISTIKS